MVAAEGGVSMNAAVAAAGSSIKTSAWAFLAIPAHVRPRFYAKIFGSLLYSPGELCKNSRTTFLRSRKLLVFPGKLSFG